MVSLPINYESDDFKLYKTLNEDVQLKPNEYNKWDIQIENGDYVNITGLKSLHNAICIAIMTRFQELNNNPLYADFGCRVHGLVKANKSEMLRYKLEVFIEEILENMRRIHEVNSIEIIDTEAHSYQVNFTVTSIDDEIVKGSVRI